ISGFVFQNLTLGVYAGIVIALDARVMDVILYGQDEARLIYIISDRHEQIAGRLMEEINIGVTYLEGEGAYTEKDKKIILCATRKQRSPEVINIVKEEDERAFLIVSSANEIFGEGYKSYWTEQL
ncbi:MAG: YitT family protein, partial [Lachnospiraceae bacterium]|nr:YitT family protein [Lachnospiraceae bacterium]